MTTFISKQQTNILQIFKFQKLLGHKNPAITEKYVAHSLPMQIDTGLRLLGMAAESERPERLLTTVPKEDRLPRASTSREESIRASTVRDRSPRASGPQLDKYKRSKLSRSGYRKSISVQGSYL